jgi:2-polyprenyl-3-methyl-5-hydroxy-6-metoxy-1,4-benzoquinol methylase
MKDIDCGPLYFDGRHYDLQHGGITDDIPLYVTLAHRYGGPILELACGTGRVTIPLAREGFSMTGLDISKPMLEHAVAKARGAGVTIDWQQGDCRAFRLGRLYGLVLFPFNSIAHLHDIESIKNCLECVRNHLTPEGRFVIDIFNPRLDMLTRDPLERYPVAEYEDPDGAGTVVITENNVYDTATQVNRIKWYYKVGKDREEMVRELNMRIFYPQELDSLLHMNGFVLEHKYGDVDLRPFVSESPRQIAVSGLA